MCHGQRDVVYGDLTVAVTMSGCGGGARLDGVRIHTRQWQGKKSQTNLEEGA